MNVKPLSTHKMLVRLSDVEVTLKVDVRTYRVRVFHQEGLSRVHVLSR